MAVVQHRSACVHRPLTPIHSSAVSTAPLLAPPLRPLNIQSRLQLSLTTLHIELSRLSDRIVPTQTVNDKIVGFVEGTRKRRETFFLFPSLMYWRLEDMFFCYSLLSFSFPSILPFFFFCYSLFYHFLLLIRCTGYMVKKRAPVLASFGVITNFINLG